jgi:DNA-directed RNA polymerase
VYSQIKDVALEIVERDAAEGEPIAEWWLPHLTRTVIKQPVMTTVYGVTPIGARRQVYGKIDNMGLKDLDRYRAAHYLSRTVLKAIGDIFHSAGSIMDWIKSHARLIAKSGALVAWTSPLGLPVVQPYRKPGPSARVTTVLGCLSVTTSSQKSRPKVSKQVNGAAPNFIHSIDASHMLMTARACAAKRIAFAAVHDSYWTHAADIDRMAAIARRQFILLHEADPLAALREEWQKKHPQITFSPLPEPGSLDLKKVADSPYFFN